MAAWVLDCWWLTLGSNSLDSMLTDGSKGGAVATHCLVTDQVGCDGVFDRRHADLVVTVWDP